MTTTALATYTEHGVTVRFDAAGWITIQAGLFLFSLPLTRAQAAAVQHGLGVCGAWADFVAGVA